MSSVSGFTYHSAHDMAQEQGFKARELSTPPNTHIEHHTGPLALWHSLVAEDSTRKAHTQPQQHRIHGMSCKHRAYDKRAIIQPSSRAADDNLCASMLQGYGIDCHQLANNPERLTGTIPANSITDGRCSSRRRLEPSRRMWETMTARRFEDEVALADLRNGPCGWGTRIRQREGHLNGLLGLDVHDSSDSWKTSPILGICAETTAVSQLFNGGIEAAYGHAPIKEAGSQTVPSSDATGRACWR